MNWQLEPRTDKQFAAIVNMQSALGDGKPIPETKGECSKLIGQLKAAIINNIHVIGKIRASSFDDDSDDDFDPIF